VIQISTSAYNHRVSTYVLTPLDHSHVRATSATVWSWTDVVKVGECLLLSSTVSFTHPSMLTCIAQPTVKDILLLRVLSLCRLFNLLQISMSAYNHLASTHAKTPWDHIRVRATSVSVLIQMDVVEVSACSIVFNGIFIEYRAQRDGEE